MTRNEPSFRDVLVVLAIACLGTLWLGMLCSAWRAVASTPRTIRVELVSPPPLVCDDVASANHSPPSTNR